MKDLIESIQKSANPSKAKDLMRFFKTGKGEYGEGDRFLGITVTVQRKIANKYSDKITLNDVEVLLQNRIHEYRLIALLVLIHKLRKADESLKRNIFTLYLKNTSQINNWDLVDLSAPKIVGEYLWDKDKSILFQLAKSSLLWERRIAVISCMAFIRRGMFDDALHISRLLLTDKHDLIHKAVGWVLREIGKKDRVREENFLKKYYKTIPRTALRYAIERFDEEKRRKILKGEFT